MADRNAFCAELADDLEGHFLGGHEVEKAEHLGDGALSVTMSDGTRFNVNVTQAVG